VLSVFWVVGDAVEERGDGQLADADAMNSDKHRKSARASNIDNKHSL